MKRSQAIANRISSLKFSFGSKTNTLFADVSELSHAGYNILDQLWADEGTEGFVMVSHRTDDEVPFVLDTTVREADGDIRAWRFVPHMHAISQNQRLRGVSVIVYNT